MRTIYVDSEHKCHPSYADNLKAVETDFFEGKCDAYIEGYCYDDSEGYVRIYPWKPYSELDNAQRSYERELLADAENALAILLGGETV